MKNKNLFIGLGVAVVLVGGFLLVRKMLKKKDENVRDNIAGGQEPIVGLDEVLPETPAEVNPSSQFNPLNPLFAVGSFLTNWNDYTVNTKSTGLNVRQKPDAKSKFVTSLSKGSLIKAKASGVKGWFAVSKDGTNTLGYVNSEFLKLPTR